MKSRQAGESQSHASQDMNLNHRLTLTSCAFKPEPGSEHRGPGCLEVSERLCNGSSDQSGLESLVSHCSRSEADPDRVRVTEEDDSRSGTVDDEDDLTPEIQQAHRIFQSFLSEKHKATTAPFWHPVGPGSQGDRALKGEMCFKRMDDKFVNREYESITEFVADFRLMLENCYRFHGVDHWISKQAQKLEVVLEQKLTLLSRTLREKTTLAMTSRGRFGTEDEKGPAGTSSRRRSVPRSLAAITVGGSESIMVQALRLEELQRAKEEKRQRELERKEAEGASAKELEDWERSLLSLAEPCPVRTMWELPAIGHFLCLAQTALNLPEIVYYELERCLLMPRCSTFLAKVMTSLLCPPHKRATLHRRPALPYRKWEAELRRRVQGWYQAVGRAEDQAARAEQLGLCHRFFWTVGETNPLQETPFHLLPFNRRVWLLKGLCDHVYETQKDVQDAVLGQPIHECRESILGYDGQENAYIHFPHFCGADLRIYRQSPFLSMEFPPPLFRVKRSEEEPGSEVKEGANERGPFPSADGIKVENDGAVCALGVREDSLRDEEEPRETSRVHCEEDSGSIQVKSTEVEDLKEEIEELDGDPCFRGGEKNESHDLNSHAHEDLNQQRLKEQLPCEACSGTSQETRPCSHRRLQNIPSGIDRRRRDDSAEEAARATCAKRKKRKQKKERKHSMKNTDKLRLKSRRVKKRLQRAAAKKQKLRKMFDMKIMSLRRKAESSLLPVEPSFQLVCSSLDDLRALISRTEDELDELNSTRKRSGRWQNKRSTVKELHITLIRLLNELLPWEPKLVKAFQKNRARLKKECEDFRKHPEYENFSREPMGTADAGDGLSKDGSLFTETTRESEDGEDKTLKEDSEAPEQINQLENHKSRCLDHRAEIIMAGNETGPFTRASKRRHSDAVSEELRPFKKGKMDPESFNPNVSRDQTSEKASVLSEPVRSFQGTYKPIQALLAKSVGNKVTLINHPKAAVMAQRPPGHRTPEPVSVSPTPPPASAAESAGQVVYRTAGGLGLLRKGGTSVKFSVQPISDQKPGEKMMQQVVILPSSLLIQSTEKKASQPTPEVTSVSVSNTTTYLSNAAGFSLPENTFPVQQVAPLKETGCVRTPSAAVVPSLRTLPTTTGALAVPKKTTKPKVTLTQTSCGSTKPDAKQELRTVCIRDSQSILVTTRGGNTGVVKVQTSEQSGRGNLTPSPVFALSPQLQAFLVSKSFTSTTQAVPGTLSARSLPSVTPLIPRGSSQSLSEDITPVRSSDPLAGTKASSVLNHNQNDSSVSADRCSAKTSIAGKSPLPTSSNTSDGVILTVKDVHQNTVSQPPQQRTLPVSQAPDQSSFEKVFLVTPSTKVPTTTATCTVPGSRVRFITRPPVSDHPTLAISKGASASEANISSASFTSPALRALKVIPNLQTALSCGASGVVTNVHSISLPASTSTVLDTNRNVSPLTSTKNTPVIVSRVLATSTSGGQQIGEKNNAVVRSNESGNSEGLLKAAGSVDGRTLTFSTLGSGHMSSALLSVIKQDSTATSVFNALSSSPGLAVGSWAADLSCSLSGSLTSKHTTLPVNVTAKNPQMISSFCTLPSSMNTTSVTSTAGLFHPTTLSSASSPPLVMTSGLRPNSATKSVQEKIVINTSAPLAPGTQLLINNTRLVVPAQGLGPGSHVLLISSSRPGDLQEANAPRGLNASPVPSAGQGMNLVSPQQRRIRLPSPPTATVGSSDRVGQQVNVRPSSGPSALPRVTRPLHSAVASEPSGLANILRLPIFQTADGKGLIVTPSPGLTETPVVGSPSQGGLLRTTSAMLLQARLANSPQNHVESLAPAVKTVISQNFPRPPMSSTTSRMQKLPVATVPPIGCPTHSSEAPPVATVPPSVNTVIMTPCQPIRAVQPGTIGKPVVLPQPAQVQSKSAVQMTSGVTTPSTASKLLLSPDGAVLNVVRASAPSSVQVLAKPMTVNLPTTSRVTVPALNTNDPLRQPDNPRRLNH